MALGLSDGNRTWVLKIVADVRDATKGIDDVEKSAQGFGDKARGIATAVGGVLAVDAVVRFGQSVVNAASDTEQAIGGTRQVFEQFSGEIESFGKTAATNMGVSNEEFLRMSTLMGSLLKNVGLPMDQVAESTKVLSQRAADLAATYGGTAADAMAAMSSALKGEFDPLQNFGITLKASTIEARAMAEGYVDASGKVTDAGKAIAAQELILEQSADAAGTFAKESGSLAGQTQTMQAQFKDLQATLGAALLPTIVQLANVLQPFLVFIANNTSWLIPLAGIILGIVAAVKAWTLAQLLLNSALFANPVGLIILAVAALGAAIVVLVKNWDTVLEVVKKVTDGIVAAWDWVYESVKYIAKLLFDIYTWPYRMAWEAIKYVFDLLYNIIQDVPRWINGAWSSITDIMTWPFRQAWAWISSMFQWLTDAFWAIPRGINSAFSGLYDIITYPFRRAMDTIKWLWNTTIGGFGFEVPSWIPGIGGRSFKIPKMAQGGIVTRPTIALIGEAGPEAVVPLSRGAAGIGGDTIINVYALTASAEVGRRVYEALQEYNRTTGKVA